MNKCSFLFTFIGIILILTTGCINSNSLENGEQNINVLKRIGNENKYKDFKKITNEKQVHIVENIINSNVWEKRKVDMPRLADYKFFFQFKNSNVETKAITYDLWISDNKNTVELVMDVGSEYVHLNKSDSEKLLEILTGVK